MAWHTGRFAPTPLHRFIRCQLDTLVPMHRFIRSHWLLQNSSISSFLWVLSSCFPLLGLFASSLGSMIVHLSNSLVPLIALFLNHQNHKTMAEWGHFPYNLPLFGDWWQTNQSNHKFCKNWEIEPLTLAWMLTIIQCWLGLPLNPSIPFVSPLWNQSCSPFGRYSFSPCFDPNFSPFGIKSPKKTWQNNIAQREKLVA